MTDLFAKKPIDQLIQEAGETGEHSLKRTLGVFQLTALGVGAVIGAGIFVLSGLGAHYAGPGLMLSFVLSGMGCAFAALCYAEFAAMIPLAGSAYTYAYATLGEIFAWIIGWDLILEYAVGNMAVAVGFGAYFNDLLDNVFGFHLPSQLTQPIFIGERATGAWFNLPSFLMVMLLTWLLVRGVRESARANTVVVIIKVGAILMFIFGAARSV